MQPPQRYLAKLEDKTVHNDKFVQYKFECTQPHRMEFVAGQYVSIKVAENGTRRSYSISSSPGIQHGFETLVDIEPAGIGCQFLGNLKFGDEIELLAPLGQFVIDTQLGEEEVVLVATGSGISPFMSMVQDLLQEKQDTRPITLYWGMRYAEHLFWQDEFRLLAENFANFKFHPVLSKAPEEWPLCRGRVTDCLSVHQLSQSTKAGYYLCGSAPMIADVSQVLAGRGVQPEYIHHEKFY